jgi:hypothetical protein
MLLRCRTMLLALPKLRRDICLVLPPHERFVTPAKSNQTPAPSLF